VPAFPKFDTSVPDVYRYQMWKNDFEKNGPANLNIYAPNGVPGAYLPSTDTD
jgi:hypothetical protein